VRTLSAQGLTRMMGPSRSSFGDLMLPSPVVRALGWAMLTVAFSLPGVAWELGWVRTPPLEETPRSSAEPSRPIEEPFQSPAEVSPIVEPRTGTEVDCPGAPLPTGEVLGPGRTALAKTGAPMTFVKLGGGAFTMGSERGMSEEKPCHRVELDGFEIATYEVSNEQWQLVMKSRPSSFCTKKCLKTAPVTDVSWGDAVEFLNRLSRREGLSECYLKDSQGRVTWSVTCDGYRLPTEAEWEYMARAGTVGAYSFEGGGAKLEDYTWADGKQVHPVGQKAPNKWGLYDVHGNVEEWVWDRDGIYPSNLTKNPQGPDGNGPVIVDDNNDNSRVLRGGAFFGMPACLRSACRESATPTERNMLHGLRVARGARSSV
jgi:formylglycine-generating enzyme required for sulfatase activity